jgi:hypothetical protein
MKQPKVHKDLISKDIESERPEPLSFDQALDAAAGYLECGREGLASAIRDALGAVFSSKGRVISAAGYINENVNNIDNDSPGEELKEEKTEKTPRKVAPEMMQYEVSQIRNDLSKFIFFKALRPKEEPLILYIQSISYRKLHRINGEKVDLKNMKLRKVTQLDISHLVKGTLVQREID